MRIRGIVMAACAGAGFASTASATGESFDTSQATAACVSRLVEMHGEAARPRIERGVAQAAALWRPGDGSTAVFVEFAAEHFVAGAAALDSTFAHFEYASEMLDGHFNSMGRELRHYMDEETGPIQPLDRLLGAFDPSAHLQDDLFGSKIAFVALLNFPTSTLQERLRDGGGWSRRRWAEARLVGRFGDRVPAEAQQAVATASAAADAYIAAYNIYMHHLLTPAGERLFPEKLRLISHWGLRDELKARYAEKDGLRHQKMIAEVLEAIVQQTIPRAVVDNPRLDWMPATGEVRVSTVQDVEASPDAAAAADPAREPDARYAKLLDIFHAMQQVDRATPDLPSHVQRTFERSMEIPEAEVRALLESMFATPVASQVAGVIRKRLGRDLEPFDIWYAGFKPRARYTEADLDAITRRKYPTSIDFAADLRRILRDLGFSDAQTELVVSHVVVDPSRGAGHALGAARRDDAAHLRTRVGQDGMDYKGYNIAVHEFGHNVEQVFSLNAIDHTLLAGVPANAFTEALAFVFQGRDLELLGLAKPDETSRQMHALEEFWATCEIGAVALVDMQVWRWMYDHPEATPAELRAATIQIARDTWKRTFGKLMKTQDSTLLAAYSHMLAYPLYLPNYPLGHIIAFQLEEHFAKSANMAGEFERVCRIGNLTPDAWMRQAVGAPLSAKPLIEAASRAVRAVR